MIPAQPGAGHGIRTNDLLITKYLPFPVLAVGCQGRSSVSSRPALRWVHLDSANDLIHVADPKKGESRKAFMTPAVKKMFQSRGRGAPEELVFPARGAKHIVAISKAFSRAVERMGFNDGITDARQKVSFHTLRHTFASWLAIQGTPILAIKELMGHHSLAMTERYSHLIPDMKREAVAGIAKLMEKRNGVVPKGATAVDEPGRAARKRSRREDQASV